MQENAQPENIQDMDTLQTSLFLAMRKIAQSVEIQSGLQSPFAKLNPEQKILFAALGTIQQCWLTPSIKKLLIDEKIMPTDQVLEGLYKQHLEEIKAMQINPAEKLS